MSHPLTNAIEDFIKAMIANERKNADTHEAVILSRTKDELDKEIEKLDIKPALLKIM